MPLVNPPKSLAPVVIAIDGPAGAGKSTVAKRLAKELGFTYLDTGAMYRALTLKALRSQVKLDDEQALIALAQRTTIDFQDHQGQALTVLLDGQDVTTAIRSEEVTNNTFYIARAPGVRGMMVDWQRQIGQKNNIVVEGRDIGTVVFPQATKKFYLDANFEERSKRRIKELQDKGVPVDDQELKNELQIRDTKDMTRPVGPLKKADDAILIDSTFMTIDDVVHKILDCIQNG